MSEVPKELRYQEKVERIHNENTKTISKNKDNNQYITLNIPSVSPKNGLYSVAFALFSTMIIVGILTSETIAMLGIGLTLGFIMIIGCSEVSRMSKIGKEVQRVKNQLSNSNDTDKQTEKSSTESIIAFVVFVGGIALMIIFPPIILLVLFIRAIMASIPKIKWLRSNSRSFFAGLFLLYFIMLISLFANYVLKDFVADHSGNKVIISIIAVSILMITILFLLILTLLTKKNVYETLRTISAIPIMIILIVLPFIAVGLVAYAMYSDTQTDASQVGVHNVEGHVRTLSDGRMVYVQPYLRTNPDGILMNNFSYRD